MRAGRWSILVGLGLWGALIGAGRGEVVFEMNSVYHHILVLDEGGVRTLSFDGTRETRMSLKAMSLTEMDPAALTETDPPGGWRVSGISLSK